jgi:hypothetical protein
VEEQPALLIRRITPYGYFVLKNMKGIAHLRGKLMVSMDFSHPSYFCSR